VKSVKEEETCKKKEKRGKTKEKQEAKEQNTVLHWWLKEDKQSKKGVWGLLKYNKRGIVVFVGGREYGFGPIYRLYDIVDFMVCEGGSIDICSSFQSTEVKKTQKSTVGFANS
jgi:hypothetical protein